MKILQILKSLVPSAAQFLFVGAIVAVGVLAYNAGRRGDPLAPANPDATPAGHAAHPADKNGDGIIHVCSMHPQIQQDEPGDCPICGMELVATRVGEPGAAAPSDSPSHDHVTKPTGYACAMNCLPPREEPGDCPVCGMEMQPVMADAPPAAAEGSPRLLTLSPEAVALMNVETSVVRRGSATRELNLVGELVEDPQRRHHLSANVGGRIDVLHARFERDRVEAGQPIAEIYSPELLAVQEELLQAVASVKRWQEEGNQVLALSAQESVSVIRRRLLLAGLTNPQVDSILQGGRALERLTLHSPVGGVVTARYVEQGQYVEREQRIVTIADYGELWAELEAFNSDLSAIGEGTDVSLTIPSQPGREFQGTVAWMDPITNTATRTARIRVVMNNTDQTLKPGMYVRAVATVQVRGDDQPLIIPHSAPLLTGRRAVVYTMDPSEGRPTFIGRVVELGDRVREGYIVLSGLEEGERVVTRGAFQIDSSLQILARPSMMNPVGDTIQGEVAP